MSLRDFLTARRVGGQSGGDKYTTVTAAKSGTAAYIDDETRAKYATLGKQRGVQRLAGLATLNSETGKAARAVIDDIAAHNWEQQTNAGVWQSYNRALSQARAKDKTSLQGVVGAAFQGPGMDSRKGMAEAQANIGVRNTLNQKGQGAFDLQRWASQYNKTHPGTTISLDANGNVEKDWGNLSGNSPQAKAQKALDLARSNKATEISNAYVPGVGNELETYAKKPSQVSEHELARGVATAVSLFAAPIGGALIGAGLSAAAAGATVGATAGGLAGYGNTGTAIGALKGAAVGGAIGAAGGAAKDLLGGGTAGTAPTQGAQEGIKVLPNGRVSTTLLRSPITGGYNVGPTIKGLQAAGGSLGTTATGVAPTRGTADAVGGIKVLPNGRVSSVIMPSSSGGFDLGPTIKGLQAAGGSLGTAATGVASSTSRTPAVATEMSTVPAPGAGGGGPLSWLTSDTGKLVTTGLTAVGTVAPLAFKPKVSTPEIAPVPAYNNALVEGGFTMNPGNYRRAGNRLESRASANSIVALGRDYSLLESQGGGIVSKPGVTQASRAPLRQPRDIAPGADRSKKRRPNGRAAAVLF